MLVFTFPITHNTHNHHHHCSNPQTSEPQPRPYANLASLAQTHKLLNPDLSLPKTCQPGNFTLAAWHWYSACHGLQEPVENADFYDKVLQKPDHCYVGNRLLRPGALMSEIGYGGWGWGSHSWLVLRRPDHCDVDNRLLRPGALPITVCVCFRVGVRDIKKVARKFPLG